MNGINGSYHDQQSLENEMKLREIIAELPSFCKEFFRGIEATTLPRTRLAYAYDLRLFFHYLTTEVKKYNCNNMKEFSLENLDTVTVTDIEDYLDYLKVYESDNVTRGNDIPGIMRKLAALRKLYNYFYKKEKIKTNSPALVETPKTHEKAIIRLDIDEVAKLLDEVETGDKLTDSQKKYHNKTKVRDLALISLLLGTGIRVSECVGIDLNDIDFNNNGVKIHRKGGNEAIVYFGEEVREVLENYIVQRQQIVPYEGHENALFLSMQRKRISVRSVEKLVKKYASLVTSIKKITPHKLRSTYGTNLYRETGDIYLVADVLGHKDVNTTRKHYAAIDEDRRKSAAGVVKLRKSD